MKWLIGLLTSAMLLFGFLSSAHASDWDVAGKILTGIAGLRVLTGGKVDIIGTMTGVGHNYNRGVIRKMPYYQGSRFHDSGRGRRIWVPYYVWKKKWVPGHKEYDAKLGKVIVVEGHYVRYQVETGGYWEWEYASKNKKYLRRY